MSPGTTKTVLRFIFVDGRWAHWRRMDNKAFPRMYSMQIVRLPALLPENTGEQRVLPGRLSVGGGDNMSMLVNILLNKLRILLTGDRLGAQSPTEADSAHGGGSGLFWPVQGASRIEGLTLF